MPSQRASAEDELQHYCALRRLPCDLEEIREPTTALFAKRTSDVSDLLPELNLHGSAQGDFELALRGLLGDETPLSENTRAAEDEGAGRVRGVEQPSVR